MKAALNGHYRAEELFVLQQSLDAWKFYQKQLEMCDAEMTRVLAQIPTARPATVTAPPKPVPPAPGASSQRSPKKRAAGGNNTLNGDLAQWTVSVTRSTTGQRFS